MNPHKQRIACAELDGWEHIKTWEDGDPSGWPPDELSRIQSIESGCDPEIPDYLNDRNSIIGLIQKMDTFGDFAMFDMALNHIIAGGAFGPGNFCQKWQQNHGHHRFWQCVTAEPKQLCEALLRTKGKWDED